jgi:hypothetical protein
MKDQLESFIRQNRQEFDDKEPPVRAWREIEHSVGFRPEYWKQPVIWWRAAAIFFMALSAYLMLPRQQMRAENVQAMQEFSDVEAFYVQQISNKVQMIDEINGSDGLNGFTHDFQQLEAMYLVLKEEMKTRPSQKVKDALVLNLLVRIDLLNQHLKRMEEEQVGQDKPVESKERRST